jgi:hypothetical protein
MRLSHLGQRLLDQLRPYLTRMETEGIDRVLLELFVVVEEDETR